MPADRYQRFRLEQPSFGISGLEPDGALFKCVSGSEGLVGVGRYQRFRLGFEPGSAPSIERSQGADLGECASRSSLLSCELQVEGGGVCY